MSKKNKKAEPETSWRKIKQSSAARAVTSFAKKRRLQINMRYVGAVLGGLTTLALIAGAVWWWQTRAFSALAVPQAPLKSIYFESDGVLNEAWLREQIEVPTGASLMDIDIATMRKQLLASGQTRTAEVERIFPDALKISVTEHRPILRIVTMDAQGKRYLYLVSESGQVYHGSHYSPATLAALPFLDGVILKRSGTGFEPIRQAAVLTEFLTTARTGWPELYSDWKIISCRHFQGDVRAPGASIVAQSRSFGDIVFTPEDFPRQLQRLEAIQAYARRERLPRLQSVDLSLDEPAVRLAANERRAGPHASR